MTGSPRPWPAGAQLQAAPETTAELTQAAAQVQQSYQRALNLQAQLAQQQQLMQQAHGPQFRCEYLVAYLSKHGHFPKLNAP
jgi:hypothetical protein